MDLLFPPKNAYTLTSDVILLTRSCVPTHAKVAGAISDSRHFSEASGRTCKERLCRDGIAIVRRQAQSRHIFRLSGQKPKRQPPNTIRGLHMELLAGLEPATY